MTQQTHERYYDTSLWDYKPVEFKRFISTISDKSLLVPEVLANFREFTVIPRKFRDMTIAQVSVNPKLIQELLDIRNGMQPETGFKLGCKPKVREQQLIENIAESYPIDKTKAKAKVTVRQYKDHPDHPNQCYNYALEVVIAPRNDLSDYHAGEIEIIDCINDEVSSDGNGAYFANGIYQWQEKRRDVFGTDYHRRVSDGLRSLLHDCGFVTGDFNTKRRKPCVLFINLKCRVIDFLGAKGKTQINTKPFADTIAEVVSSLASKMPTYHGLGYGRQYTSSDDESRGEYMEPYLKPFLKKRRQEVEANSSLRIKDRLTQSGVWYRIRPIMIEDGFKPRNKSIDKNGRVIYDWGTTRSGLTNRIREAIKELWPNEEHVTREYLGIVAKARAMMYFNGRVYPVSFDSLDELSQTGTTDLVVVEKEGIVDVLLGAAIRYRIALVATGGQLSDYAKDLVRLANEAGINVCVLTDYDIHGINIWRKAGASIKRIGIDNDIITWLQDNGYFKEDGSEITDSDVGEDYEPNPKLFTEDDDEYLQTRRIELDAVVEKAGANALFHYLIEKLEEIFPDTRDYSNIIAEPEPENYYSEDVTKFIEYIKNYIKGSYNEEWTQINKDAEEVDILTDVDLEEEANDIILKPVVHEDEGMKTISTKLKELMESGALPKAKEISKEEQKPKQEPKPVDNPKKTTVM